MSLEGNATAEVVLRGTINNLDTLVIDAYDIAVKNGFDGTEEEWLASLKGEKGADGENADLEGAVLYTEQTLTDEQKAQARENIGAAEWMMLPEVDSELDATSGNAVANRAVAQAVNKLDGRLAVLECDPYTDYQPDVPENIGVLNTILNFKQIAEVPIALKGTLPVMGGDWSGAATRYGLPYSSSRIEEGFVPNFVSMETFMTALQNPNSYLYTVDLGELGNQNGDTYYGSVCSVACAYALNIEPNYTTHQWQDVPGMEMIPWQSVYALELGDTICHHTSGHIVMVTDITRNKRGRIGTITISEAAKPSVRHNKPQTPEEVAKQYPTSDYGYFRYNKIHEVQHIQSPFVAVEDETPMEFTYNTTLIPRKGDKANWLQGIPVEIDLLAKGNYTTAEIYKDDVLYDSVAIKGGDEQPVDRTVYGLSWETGNLTTSTNKTQKTTTYIPSTDIIVTVADGAKVKIGFYDAEQTRISTTSDWLTGEVSVKDIAPDTAKLCRIAVSLTDESEIPDVNTVASKITISVPSNVDAIPIVLEANGLASANGGEVANNARLRTDFLPLQNVQLTGSDKVQYYIYYYDASKGYLGNSGAWKSGTVNMMDGVPSGTAYFRLVVKNSAGSTIYLNGGTYSLEFTLTIIGGVSEGDLSVLVLDDLTYGSYKARLTDGTNNSDWCYWIVVDAVSTATATGNDREASVTFSASNAEPLFVKWAGGVDNGTKHINVLTDTEKAAGAAVVKYETAFNDGQNDTYKIRVAFQTEYGIIHTPLPEAITV